MGRDHRSQNNRRRPKTSRKRNEFSGNHFRRLTPRGLVVDRKSHQGGIGAGAGRYDHKLPAGFCYVGHRTGADWKRSFRRRPVHLWSRWIPHFQEFRGRSGSVTPFSSASPRSAGLPSPKGTRHAMSPLLRLMATNSAYGGLVMGIGPSGLEGVSAIPVP